MKKIFLVLIFNLLLFMSKAQDENTTLNFTRLTTSDFMNSRQTGNLNWQMEQTAAKFWCKKDMGYGQIIMVNCTFLQWAFGWIGNIHISFGSGWGSGIGAIPWDSYYAGGSGPDIRYTTIVNEESGGSGGGVAPNGWVPTKLDQGTVRNDGANTNGPDIKQTTLADDGTETGIDCPYQVKFDEDASRKYGFDDHTTPNTPWKSLEENNNDKVVVNIRADALYNKVNLKILDNAKLTISPSKPPASTFNLQLNGKPILLPDTKLETQVQTFCTAPSGQNLSNLNVVTYKKIKKTVKVITINSTDIDGIVQYTTTPLDEALIKNYLNEKCYNQAIVQWEVTMVTNPVNVYFDLNGDNKLDLAAILASSLWLTAEMQSIIDACKDDSKDANIFVVNNANTTTLVGKMWFGQKYGFVFPNNTNTNFYATLAHELGHGVFSLKHSELTDNTDNINNIMLHPNIGDNYPKLRKWQWDLIHNQ